MQRTWKESTKLINILEQNIETWFLCCSSTNLKICFLAESQAKRNVMKRNISSQFSLVQSLSRVQLFVTPWTAARQASLSITNSQSLLKPMSMESLMPSNHLILCHPLLLPPSIFPSIRVFSSESALRIRWPKNWSFSISPSSEYSGLIILSFVLSHPLSFSLS